MRWFWVAHWTKRLSNAGISRNTAKSHLHAVFAKTSTNRQSELVSLLLRSVAGINLRGI